MSTPHCCGAPPTLTFSHRSGVTPYTSSCELAGSCVFGKQSPGRLSLRLRPSAPHWHANVSEVSESRNGANCFFAVFRVSVFSRCFAVQCEALRKSRPYTEGTVAFLPSSLAADHSYPLGYSPYPPVSVSGTDSMKASDV